MGEETAAPSQPKTAKQLEKEAKKAAEKAAKLEKLAGKVPSFLPVALTLLLSSATRGPHNVPFSATRTRCAWA